MQDDDGIKNDDPRFIWLRALQERLNSDIDPSWVGLISVPDLDSLATARFGKVEVL